MDTKKKRGGSRPGSGRPSKLDKAQWGQITCVLKKQTIAQLKAGAASKHFGEYLQFHLDRHPLPNRLTYLALVNNEPITVEIKRRKTPVIISTGNFTPQGPSRRLTKRPRRPLTRKEYEQAILAAGS